MNLSVLLCSDSMFLIGMLVNAETYNYLTSEQSTERRSVASMVYACNFKSIRVPKIYFCIIALMLLQRRWPIATSFLSGALNA